MPEPRGIGGATPAVGYRLGIDLGTTYTAAAVAADGEVSMVALGSVTPETPTVVAIDDENQWLFGNRATRLAAVQPERVAREFKRRVGDPVPLIVAGRPVPVDDLLSATFRYVIDAASEQMGARPASTTVTHPAGWGEFKKAELRQSLEQAAIPAPRLVSEPVAAAAHYLRMRKLEPGATIAVFDFGGGTFDAAVLEHSPNHADQFVLHGEAQGLERLGGVDLDAAVFDFVVRAAELDLVELEMLGEGRKAIQRLRSDVVEAKESLSEDTFTAVTVALPGTHLTVRLTRSEFEDMVRPVVASALATVEQTISSAGLAPADLDGILLVGGSSRIPLVAQMVGAHFDTNIVVDAHPKHAVALGAATLALIDAETIAASLASASADPPPLLPRPTETKPQSGNEPFAPIGVSESEPAQLIEASLNAESDPQARHRRWLLVSAIAMAAVAMIAVIAAVRGFSGADSTANATAPAQADAQEPGGGIIESAGDLIEGPPAAFADLLGVGSRSETGGRIARHDVHRYASDGPAEAPSARWSIERSQEPFSSVLGAEGLVFSLDRIDLPDATFSARTVSARDQASGEVVWMLDVDGATDLTLVNDALFVSRPDGIDVIEWRTGVVRGELTGLRVTPGPVLVRNGLALVNGKRQSFDRTPNVIAVIDTRTAQLVWRHDEPTQSGFTVTAFMADNDTVVYATNEQTIAFDVNTGAERWRTSDFDASDLVLMGDNVIVLNRSGGAEGIDAKTGESIWARPDRVFVAASDGVSVITVQDDGTLESVSLASGETTWMNHQFAGTPAATLAVGNNSVFAATTDGGLLAVALATGATAWAIDLGDVVLGSSTDLAVSVAGGDLIVANANEFFLLSDGEVADVDAEPVFPLAAVPLAAVVGDGDVVVSAHAGFLPASASFVEEGPVAEPSLLWAVERASDTSPAVAAGGLVIYVDERVADERRQSVLIGADATTGREQWSTTLEGFAFAVHVVNMNVIVHTTDGFLAFELSTGRRIGPLLDESFTPSASSFIVRGGALVIAKRASGASQLTTIESFDLETGASNWAFVDDAAVGPARQVLFGNSVAVMSTSGSLVGVDLSSGEELWRTLITPSDLPGVMIDDQFLFARGLAELALVDGRTGRDVAILGSFNISTVSDGMDVYLYDIEAQSFQRRMIPDGSTVWSSREVGSTPLLSMTVAGGTLYVVEGTKMTALDTSDGSLIWSMALGEAPGSLLYGAVGADVIVLTDSARISVFG